MIFDDCIMDITLAQLVQMLGDFLFLETTGLVFKFAMLLFPILLVYFLIKLAAR